MKILEKLNTNIIKFFSSILLRKNITIREREINKLLIVAHLGIGDCVFFLPVIRNLRQKLPETNITVLTHNRIIRQIINHHFPELDIIEIDLRNLSIVEKFSFFVKMRKIKFDIFLANFLGSKKEYIQLALINRIPIRIGHTFEGLSNGGKFDFFFNYPII